MHKQTDQVERPKRAGHGGKLASRLGSGGTVRAGESPAISTLDRLAAEVLAKIEPVKHISCFGEALIHSGAVKLQVGKRYTRQGYALFAGRALRRLQSHGMAVHGLDGWRSNAKVARDE